MTAKKAAAKKPAKKAERKPEPDAKPVAEAAAPEMEGDAYQAGFHGPVGDQEDYSMAAEVARLSEA